jgi:hypothetical protein
MDHSSIIFDFELDFLEQYQTETLLQILKDKYGKGTRIKAGTPTVVLRSLKTGLFVFTVTVPAALRKKTPGFSNSFLSGWNSIQISLPRKSGINLKN